MLIDSRVVAAGSESPLGDTRERGVVIVGSGLRRSKLALAGSLLAELPGAEVVSGLAIG